MAWSALPAFSRSGSPSISPSAVGIICHERPYLSLSQPQLPSSPPSAVNLFHNSSTSSCVLQLTKNDIDSLNLKTGPAFNPINSCPSSSKLTDWAMPLGPGVTLSTLEFLKMET